MEKIVIINGPNLNFLGIREREIYGNETYEDICKYVLNYFSGENVEIEIFQSNGEGEIIDKIQKSYYEKVKGIVINPGAYTHYSYAIYDCIKSVSIPTIEVHISDINSREEFRKISVIKEACVKQISGKGKKGYIEGVQFLINNY